MMMTHDDDIGDDYDNEDIDDDGRDGDDDFLII